jgi:hypothetical protein
MYLGNISKRNGGERCHLQLAKRRNSIAISISKIPKTRRRIMAIEIYKYLA